MSGLDTLFRKGQEEDMSLEDIRNRFDLDFSFNFVFDDVSRFDSGATDPNVVVSDGKLVLDSGSSGVFISVSKNVRFDVSKVHVRAAGEDLGSAVFAVSADNGNTWLDVTLDALETVIAQGRNLRLRVSLNASTVRIDSVVILFS